MVNLNDREQAFEARFVAEEEKEFKAKAKRNVRLAAVVADELGYAEEEKNTYVKNVLNDFLQEEVDRLVDKMICDFEAEEKPYDRKELLKMADALLAQARQEIRGGK